MTLAHGLGIVAASFVFGMIGKHDVLDSGCRRVHLGRSSRLKVCSAAQRDTHLEC